MELARDAALHIVERLPEGLVVTVRTRGGLVTPAITLFPEDPEWSCACGAPACEHAAAAAIALSREAPPAVAGRIGYRLSRARGALALARVIVVDEQEHPIAAPLEALLKGRVEAPPFAASAADRRLEDAHGGAPRGEAIPRERAVRVLDALRRCEDVRLDGAPVAIARDPVLPIARVLRAGDGHIVRLASPPSLQETFTNGIARVEGVLRPVGDPRLTVREREQLPRGVRYGPERLGELASSVIPGLRERMPVEIDDPLWGGETVRVAPHLIFTFDDDAGAIVVRTVIVYGDPPLARVEDGVLRHLGGPVPARDPAAEAELARLARAVAGMPPGLARTMPPLAAAALWAEAARAGLAREGDAERACRIDEELTAIADFDGSRLDIAFTTASGSRADARDVLARFDAGASLVSLRDGGFAPLPRAWLERHAGRVRDLLAARGDDGTLARAARIDLARLIDEAAWDQPRALASDPLAALARAPELPAPELPALMAPLLRPYQRTGASWLCQRRDLGLGALLADDMGLGKTVQAAAALRGRCLVIAPASVIAQWRDEVARFRPDLRAAIYHGAGRALDDDAPVTITTYGVLRVDIEVLSSVAWDVVVLDESNAIKTPEGQTARAARRLNAAARIALSGTPVENRLEELWSQMAVLNPGLLGTQSEFRAHVARPIENGDAEALLRLRARLAPFVLRRLKRDVAPELPPRTETVLRIALDERERAVYDTVRAATRADVARWLEMGNQTLRALEALLRLRQAACHPALVPGQSAESSSKLEVLAERLVEASALGHRALVFSQWTTLLDLAEKRLAREGLTWARLDGSTRDRAGVVASFQDDPQGPPVMLISLKAGGVGLNLTAADHVFVLDPWWNPAAEDQAADRAHRIGQTRPVNIYKLVAEGTVEERVLALQAAKRSLADAAITRDDVLAILDEPADQNP